MDKNTELRSSLLYFVDEVIGFRKSIHHFHRWLEFTEREELARLVIEVGNEQFVDLRALVSSVETKNDKGIESALDNIKSYEFFKTTDDFNKIKAMLKRDPSIKTIVEFLNSYFGNTTLLSCVLKYINQLALVVSTYPDLNWKDAISRNQIKSKKWLLNKLSTHLEGISKGNMFSTMVEPTTIVVGGWVGILPFLASMQELKWGKVVNIDIDSGVHDAAKSLNSSFNPFYNNLDKDVQSVDFLAYKNPIVIDTIVEHFKNHGDWIKTLPSGTTVVLQGNNMFDVKDHVNCHSSLSQFVNNCGLSTIHWQGELMLYKCNRYMVIGTV